MRILVLAATVAAVALPAAAQAQYYPNYNRGYYDRGDYRDYRRDVRRAERECRRDLRRADSRREYRRELKDCRRDLREARRDYRRDIREDRRDYRRYRRYDNRYGYYDDRRYWDGYRWRYRW